MRVPGIIFDIWLDAQHLYMVIAQRAVELPALHAVAATAAIAATAATRRTRTRPTLRRVVAGAAGAAAAGRAAAQGRAGRQPVRSRRTHLPRCGHSRRSARVSKSECRCLNFAMSFSAMRGTTGQGPLRNCTICLSHAVSRSGSARRTSPSAHRCSAKLTGDWRSRESGSCW